MKYIQDEIIIDIYNRIKKEEILKDKPYKKWSLTEKIKFLKRMNIRDLNIVLEDYEKQLDNIFLQQRLDEIIDKDSRRQRDIRKLKELGFEIAYTNGIENTPYTGFIDESGRKIINKNSESVNYIDTYFYHPKKAIYLNLEHVILDNKKTIRTDVKGYMQVSKKDCFNEIKRNFFSKWLIEKIDYDTYGLLIDKYNYDIALWYLKDNRVKNFNKPLLTSNFVLEIPEFEQKFQNIEDKNEYIDTIIKNMNIDSRKYYSIKNEEQKIKNIEFK